MVDRTKYPELDLILWDYRGRFISAKEAFHKYETRWKFVSEADLTLEENTLINTLTHEYGNGMFMSA